MSNHQVTRVCKATLLAVLCVLFISSITQAKTVLTIAGHSNTKSSMEKSASEYMALHPDVEIQFLNIATDTYDGINKLLVMNIGGEMPDIIHSYLAVTPELLTAGMLAPMPANVADATTKFFLRPLIPSVTFKGRLYGIPTENQTYVFGYNQRFFDEAGVAKSPNNWDELHSLARKLTKTNGAGTVTQNGFSIQGDFIRFSHSFLTMLWANGGTYIDSNGKARLDETPAIQTAQYLADMFGPGQLSFTNNLRNNKAAMSIMPTYWRKSLMDPKLGDYANIKTTLMPNNNGPKVSYQYGWALFVSAKCPNSAAAWDYLRWATMEKSENGLTRMSDPLMALGSLPTNRLDLGRQEFRTDSFFDGFVASLDVSVSEPLIPKQSNRQEIIQKVLRPAIEGKAPVTQALASIQQQVTTVLAEFVQ